MSLITCYKCNGLGRLRTTFSTNERWIRCDICEGAGKRQRLSPPVFKSAEEASDIANQREARRIANNPMNRHKP